MTLSDLVIRPADRPDLRACLELDNSITTNYVWQIDQRVEEETINVALRKVRLPRALVVPYPRDAGHLIENWRQADLFLVAVRYGQVQGYLDLAVQPWHQAGWIHNLVVAPVFRRQRIGTALLQRARQWCQEQSLKKLMAETSTKNPQAVAFYQRHGFVFCGFNDHYYANRDIALFFVCTLG